jgi:vacuolar-type H+-ATPase subunit H
LRLFGRTSEASISRGVGDALALCEQGRVQEGRQRLEKLVAEAEEALGAENRETLLAREELGLSYADEAPERGRTLIEELQQVYERVFGKESRELLILRAHLPGLYGKSGDHKRARDLAAALIPEYERAFGMDAEQTRAVRANRSYAEEQLAQAELERLLALARDAAASTAPPDDWRAHARRAADHHGAASGYRSRLVAKSTGPGEAGTVEWQFEYVRPDALHVLQVGREQGEELFDEWIVLGEERYQNAGLWFKPDEDLNKELNEFLTADKYMELLRNGTATAAARRSSTAGPVYLILDYDIPPAAFSEFFSSEGMHENPTGETQVWIDIADDTLARVDVSLSGHSESGHLSGVKASQGFTSYGAKIEIEAPDVQIVPT